jgi:RimJ/RimL family protein N-acetyltransferase
MGAGPPDAPRPYPAHLVADVRLADGEEAHLRPVTPSDAGRIDEMHRRLSPRTLYLRFRSSISRPSPAVLSRLTNVDYCDRLAVVAERGDRIVGVGRYDRLGSSRAAEIALLVEDAHQGRGVGTALLGLLASAAREMGISTLVAEALPSNTRVLSVLEGAGFPTSSTDAEGLLRVSCDIRRPPARGPLSPPAGPPAGGSTERGRACRAPC